MPRILTCDESDYDAITGTCAAPYFAESSGWELSISDAQAIGWAIAWLWAVAWGIRQLKRMLR